MGLVSKFIPYQVCLILWLARSVLTYLLNYARREILCLLFLLTVYAVLCSVCMWEAIGYLKFYSSINNALVINRKNIF